MPAVKLVCVEGPNKGLEHRLEGKLIFDVGTSRKADIAFEDTLAAPIHCKIYREGDAFQIFDLSGRGFAVNGKDAVKATLENGDIVKIGTQSWKFVRPIDVPPEDDPGEETPPPVVADAARQKVVLRAVKGADAGKVFDISAREHVVLGRGIATDITVWDIRVSRVHCRLDADGGGYVVRDLQSSNGTYVNGQKIETHRLQNGDFLKLGSSVLQFAAG